jgi:tetratricopeptide (TPR) repeat protein
VKETKRFGARIRELRTGLSITLKELSAKVNVDITYLSKIENGVMPPPSEEVILRLAENLNTDKDELLILAGKLPSDIVEILQDREVVQLLRSGNVREKLKALSRERQSVHRLGKFKGVSEAVIHNSVARVAIAVFLAVLIATLLWFAAPTTESAVAINNQGVDYNRKGEYNTAVETFDRAIELDPAFAPAYSNRGWTFLELGQYEKAIADSNKAIELDPALAFAYNNRGLAHIRLGKYEQGITDCNKAIELDPGLALAYSNRGQAYLELGQYEKAIADFDRAMQLDPSLQK